MCELRCGVCVENVCIVSSNMIETVLLALAAGGSCLFGTFGMKLWNDCVSNRKLVKNLGEMHHENERLQACVEDMSAENARMSVVRGELEDSAATLKDELDALKGLIDLAGDHQQDVYEATLKLFREYNAVVHLDVHNKALGILQSLDTDHNFVMSDVERTNAVKSLNLLFGENHGVALANADFDDLEVLKEKIVTLIKRSVVRV